MTEPLPTADGIVERAPGGSTTVRFDRRLRHPVERVWEALTDPDELRSWWGDTKLELVKGGPFQLRWRNTDGNGNVATLDMTLTSAACPLTDVIEDQTRAALTAGPGGGLVKDFRINWVWMPPWGPEKITEDGREQLRPLGFTV